MKKIIATIMAVGALVSYAGAQGAFVIDNGANAGNGSVASSTSSGRVFIDGILDTANDINVSVLWGTASTAVNNILDIATYSGGNGAPYSGSPNWFASQPTGGSDITFNGNGTLVDPNGGPLIVSGLGVGAGSVVWIIIQGWTGSAADYATAASTQGAAVGQTTAFSLTLAATGGPIYPDTHTAGSLNLVTVAVPEPSTLALAGLGGFGMLMAMRRKKA